MRDRETETGQVDKDGAENDTDRKRKVWTE